MATKKEAAKKKKQSNQKPRQPKLIAVEQIRPDAVTVVVEADEQRIAELHEVKHDPKTMFEKIAEWWNA
jgi:hypothetical protein